MTGSERLLEREAAAPGSLPGRLFDAAYETGKGLVKDSREAVTEHPWLTAGAVAAAVGLFVLTRGRSARGITEGLVARSGAGAAETGVVESAVVTLRSGATALESCAAQALRAEAPGVAGLTRAGLSGQKAAASELVEVPILKGPWEQATVSRVPLSADHWVTRNYLQKKDAVVQIIRNGERQGTGFFVDEGGLVVTNHHVVGSPKLPYQIALSDGSCYSVKVLSMDPGADLAVLKVLKPGSRRFSALEVGSSTSKSANEVVALGFPEDVRFVVASPGSYLGHETAAVGRNLQRRVEFDMVMKRGNSGSPVLDRDGRVAAVLNRYTFRDQAYGASGEHLKALLEATRSTETGSRFLVVDTSLPSARATMLQRVFGTAGDAALKTEAATVGQPLSVSVRRAVLTSKPPVSA